MNLSVIWRLQDLMTPTMRRVNQVASSTQRVVEKANAIMSNAFRNSGLSAKDLQTKLEKIRDYRDGLKIGINDREIRRANAAVDILQTKLDKVQNTGAGKTGGLLGGIIPGGMKGLVAGLGLMTAINTGQDMLSRGMMTDRAEQSFKYFVQNERKAQNIIDQLDGFSKKYAMYSKMDLMQGANLISDTMGADNTMKITNMVAKLAQGDTGNYMGIITRLQQVRGTGYLQGDELMELMNRGVFGLQEEIARFRGVSMAKFNKLKEAQQISYNEVEGALLRMTSAGGKYDKILDTIAKTTYGKWQTIRNSIRSATANVGKDVGGALNGALDWVIRFIEQSAPIGRAFDSLGRSFSPLLNGLYRMAVSFGLVSSGGDSARGAVELVTKVVNALAWVVNTAAKAVSWLAGVFEQYPWTKYAAGFLGINYAVRNIDFILLASNLIQVASKFLSFPFGLISGGFKTIATSVNILRNSFLLMNAANPVVWIIAGVAALAAALYIAWQKSETFRRVVIQTWEGLKYLWNGVAALVMQAWGKIQPYILLLVKLWSWAWNVIGVVAKAYWAYLTGMFKTITTPLVNAFERVKDPIFKVFNWIKDTALKFIRLTAGIVTLGLSEVGIFAAKKFKVGFDQGAAAADAKELARRAQSQLDKVAPKKGFFENLTQGKLPGMNMPKMDNLSGADLGKAAGITDTVTGAKSNQVTININSKIADINNYFSGEEGDESISKKITDGVLMELNRILNTGHRLALD